jgi:hypothetical protein
VICLIHFFHEIDSAAKGNRGRNLFVAAAVAAVMILSASFKAEKIAIFLPFKIRKFNLISRLTGFIACRRLWFTSVPAHRHLQTPQSNLKLPDQSARSQRVLALTGFVSTRPSCVRTSSFPTLHRPLTSVPLESWRTFCAHTCFAHNA